MRTSRRRSTIVVMLLLVLSLVVSTSSVQATYPGMNGRIAFSVFGADGNVDIYTALPNGEDYRRLTDSPAFDACSAYSPDGTTIAFCTDRSGAFEIWMMDYDGSNERPLTDLGWRSLFPDFSPDGTRVAFDSDREGNGNSDIYITNTDGSDLIQLTTDPLPDGYPAWSPDGTKIVFIRFDLTTEIGQVWVMDADGTNQTQLTHDPFDKGQLPDWSPDGSKIAYQNSATGNGDIYVMNADGSEQTRLTDDEGLEFGAAWSPDGTQIAFLRLPVGEGQVRSVYVMNAAGGNAHPVHPSQTQLVPAWQPLGANPQPGVGGHVLTAPLYGEHEVPGPGDPDGFGFAKIIVNAELGQLCFRVSVAGIDGVTGAHIHEGLPGVAGPVVVPLSPLDLDGLSEGCVALDPILASAIAANPANYYVNVHTDELPAGALRGHLAPQ